MMLGKGQEIVGGFRVKLFAGFVDNIQVLKNSTFCLLLHVATIFCWKVVVHSCSSLSLPKDEWEATVDQAANQCSKVE